MPIQPYSPKNVASHNEDHQSTLPIDGLQPTDCTVFGTLNVRVTPPTAESIRRAPQYSRLALQENCRLATEDLKIALSQATNNYLAIVAILKFAEATENAYLEAQIDVMVEARVKAEKTERDRTISMYTRIRGADHAAPSGQDGKIISFKLPASKIVMYDNKAYIPLWLAKKSFKEVQSGSRDNAQHLERVPAGRPVWLGKAGLIASLLMQLPASGRRF